MCASFSAQPCLRARAGGKRRDDAGDEHRRPIQMADRTARTGTTADSRSSSEIGLHAVKHYARRLYRNLKATRAGTLFMSVVFLGRRCVCSDAVSVAKEGSRTDAWTDGRTHTRAHTRAHPRTLECSDTRTLPCPPAFIVLLCGQMKMHLG